MAQYHEHKARPFTDGEIRLLRRRLAAGENRRQLANEYCVSKVTIERIARRETYDWVPAEEPRVIRPQITEEELNAIGAELLRQQEEVQK